MEFRFLLIPINDPRSCFRVDNITEFVTSLVYGSQLILIDLFILQEFNPKTGLWEDIDSTFPEKENS